MRFFDLRRWGNRVSPNQPKRVAGGALFVMTLDGKVYADQSGRATDIALADGAREVTAAGRIVVRQGRILEITNESPTYHPSVAQMLRCVERLAGKGTDLKGDGGGVVVIVYAVIDENGLGRGGMRYRVANSAGGVQLVLEPPLSGSALRDALFNAAQRGDERELDSLCRANHDRVLEEFKTWLRTSEPLRAPEAINRYGQGLAAVAEWFERDGSPQLMAALEGEPRDNPISRWSDALHESDVLKGEGRFEDATAVLEKLVGEMSKYQGTAAEQFLPMVHGSLGECFFHLGQLDRASEITRVALDGCLNGGDMEGIIEYTSNLAEICGKGGDEAQQRYWLILSTNAMIQAGQKERATGVRRLHSIEPIEGLISSGPIPAGQRPNRT